MNRQPTRFPERILLGVIVLELPGLAAGPHCANYWLNAMRSVDELKPKIHTLRSDGDNDWVPGKVIDFCSGEGVDRVVFAKGQCVSTQQVIMRYDGVRVHVWVDDRRLEGANLVEFYQNDGFDSFEDFDNWFAPICIKTHNAGQPNKKFKLIHWSSKRY